ncbi:MAG TPA: protein kinase [Thermoanaerobaculia bacterium]|nr:protein kinase [Thermoanaerobaculia bacterium]
MDHARENQQLGGFRLLRLIGSGGMGEVWLAEDTKLCRIVAIKILPQHIAESHEARARLLREARLAAQLNHPSIATIHTVEEQNGFLFLAMEFVEGMPLAAALKERKLSDYDVVRIGRDIAEALAEAHTRGIVHRDIKPDNVMISGRRVKVLDFGVAKQVGEQRHREFNTEVGMVVGTPEYMSPEQALGRAVDSRTDIFSLGVLLYHALSGTLPFSGTSVTELLLKICRDEPVPFFSVRPDLPEKLSKVIGKCMEKNREQRFATAVELAGALDRVLPRLSRGALPVTPTVVLSATDAAAAVVAEPAPVIELRPPAAEPNAVASPTAGRRMLIADDDAAIRRLFAALARRQGIECDTASNGPEAIALLKQREYALMFLDIMMPRIDGWGVLDFLRTRATRVPTLFIVTAFLDQTVSAADKEIVSGIIYKPADADELAALMRECARGTMRMGVLMKTRHRLIALAG